MPEPTITGAGTTAPAVKSPATGPSSGAGQTDREFAVKERSQLRQSVQRFLRHRLAVISLLVFVALVLFAFITPLFWQYSYTDITPDNSVSPTWDHPFGTDNLGHDLFAQVLRGLQQSTKIAICIALLATGLGSLWGVVAGFFGRRIDATLMRFADLVLTIPGLALSAALANHFGGTWWIIAVILGSLAAPYVGRVVRGLVLSIREREFIEASRALGASNSRIMFRHLIPNALPVIIVNATLLVATGILAETALSYVGFGVRAPDTSLGLLVTNARQAVMTRPWLFYFPGIFIILFALSVNFLGDGLRDALDPRQTRQRR